MVIPHDLYMRFITACVLTAIFLIAYYSAPLLLSGIFLSALLIILLYEWPRIGIWWLTPVYPVAPFMMLILLNQSTQRALILFIFITCALFDTAGYIVGSFLGTHKLAPHLSPKKTWEGLLGGICTVFTIAPLLCSYLNMTSRRGIFFWLFIALFCLLAFAGDLLISYFKRKAGVKDTSSLLPGHGGLLDRFDSILLTTMLVSIL